jgi:hypothetical protein
MRSQESFNFTQYFEPHYGGGVDNLYQKYIQLGDEARPARDAGNPTLICLLRIQET